MTVSGRFSRGYKVAGGLGAILVVLVVGAWNIHTSVSTERTFDAPAANVWRVWNDASSIEKWWGRKGYTALVARNDAQPGGSYLWAMKSARGKVSWNTGTYMEVVENKKLVSTMSFSDESGRAVPGSKLEIPGRWPDFMWLN